jgi:D-inositol-3-phosphate glycosyltransferase
VLDGITGFLVPPREPRLLADRLLQLQRDPTRAAAFGRAGVQRVRTHFTWDEIARQLVQVYRSVCDHALVRAQRASRVAEATTGSAGALGLVSAS